MTFLTIAIAALIGGLSAAVTGGLIEIVRALLTPARRLRIMHRSLRENLRHFMASPAELAKRGQ